MVLFNTLRNVDKVKTFFEVEHIVFGQISMYKSSTTHKSVVKLEGVGITEMTPLIHGAHESHTLPV